MIGLSDKKFGTTVPSSCDIFSHLFNIFGNKTCKAEIAQFKDMVIMTEENIFRLYVSVDDVFLMQELETLDDFIDDDLYFFWLGISVNFT